MSPIFISWVHGCMPPYQQSKLAAITSLFLYGNDHFLYQLLSKCIICNIFSKVPHETKLPHSKRAVKVIIFYTKVVIFGNILKQNLIKTYTKLLYFSLSQSKHAAIISLFLYQNDNFLHQLLSKHTSIKCIKGNIFSIFSRELKYPIASVQVKSLFFYIKMVVFGNIL